MPGVQTCALPISPAAVIVLFVSVWVEVRLTSVSVAAGIVAVTFDAVSAAETVTEPPEGQESFKFPDIIYSPVLRGGR